MIRVQLQYLIILCSQTNHQHLTLDWAITLLIGHSIQCFPKCGIYIFRFFANLFCTRTTIHNPWCSASILTWCIGFHVFNQGPIYAFIIMQVLAGFGAIIFFFGHHSIMLVLKQRKYYRKLENSPIPSAKFWSKKTDGIKLDPEQEFQCIHLISHPMHVNEPQI